MNGDHDERMKIRYKEGLGVRKKSYLICTKVTTSEDYESTLESNCCGRQYLSLQGRGFIYFEAYIVRF